MGPAMALAEGLDIETTFSELPAPRPRRGDPGRIPPRRRPQHQPVTARTA
jgi:hypothetical protein